MRASRSITLAVVAMATGCLSTLGPPPVGGEVAACEDVDSDPATDISFERDIRVGLFTDQAHCVKCHTPGGATPIGIQRSGLDLTSYATLRAGGTRSSAGVVVDGKPCSSIIVQKISPAPPFGSRMPLNGPPYLTDAQQQIIIDWIVEGAHDN